MVNNKIDSVRFQNIASTHEPFHLYDYKNRQTVRRMFRFTVLHTEKPDYVMNLDKKHANLRATVDVSWPFRNF